MDRFYRGLVAGVVAAIPLNAWNLLSFYVLRFTDRRMLDWSGMILYGSIPQTTFQIGLALVMQILWSGFRGVVFSHLFPHFSSQGYLGKAVFFSVFLGFLEEAIAVLYKVPNLAEMTSGTALSTILGAILWGVLLGYLVPRFARRQERQKAG